LEKIPSLIEKYQADTEKISKDLPVLQEIVNSTWRREDELKELKTELAALDRKIQLSLKPVGRGEDEPAEEEDNKRNIQQTVNTSSGTKSKEESKLSSGGMKQDEFSRQYDSGNTQTVTLTDRLQQAKEAMKGRLIIGSVPKYHNENQPKGVKL
jgi:hypothetical protein